MRRRLTDWASDDVLANEREGEASKPLRPARAQGDPSLQRLQRLAGNRAVTSLVLPTRSLVVQREPTTKFVNELERKFRLQGYPIGSSSIPKLTGGTGNY